MRMRGSRRGEETEDENKRQARQHDARASTAEGLVVLAVMRGRRQRNGQS